MSRSDVAKRLSPAKRELLNRLRSSGTRARSAGDSGPILLRPGGGSPALVLIHPVGGALFCYATLTGALRTTSPVYGFADALELESETEAPAQSIPRLASRYLAQLRAEVSGPWVLGGWSFGGLVAYEMARQSAAKSRVLLLDAGFVSEDEGTPPPDSELRRWFARDIARLAGVPDDDIGFGSGNEELGELVERTGAEPGLGRDELFERYRIFAANSRSLLAYRPRSYDGAVTLVLAEASPDITGDWTQYVSGPIDCHVVPGDHYEMLTGPSAERLACIIDDVLLGTSIE